MAGAGVPVALERRRGQRAHLAAVDEEGDARRRRRPASTSRAQQRRAADVAVVARRQDLRAAAPRSGACADTQHREASKDRRHAARMATAMRAHRRISCPSLPTAAPTDCPARAARPPWRRQCSPRSRSRGTVRARRTSVSQSASSVGLTSSMKSCIAPDEHDSGERRGQPQLFQHHRDVEVQVGHAGGAIRPSCGRPNSVGQLPGGVKREQRQPWRPASPCPRRRARPAVPPPSTSSSVSENIDVTRSRSCASVQRMRAAPPAVPSEISSASAPLAAAAAAPDERRQHALRAALRRRRQSRRDRRRAGRTVQQRHAQRERVALVRGQLRRLEDALEVEPAQRQRRERDVEAEQRAADVPRHAGRHLRARHGPREPQPQLGVLGAEPEIVAARDVVGQQHRAFGIADVGGVGNRQQRVAPAARRRARSSDSPTRVPRACVLVPDVLRQLVDALSQRLVRVRRRRHAGRRRSRRRRGSMRRGDLVEHPPRAASTIALRLVERQPVADERARDGGDVEGDVERQRLPASRAPAAGGWRSAAPRSSRYGCPSQ